MRGLLSSFAVLTLLVPVALWAAPNKKNFTVSEPVQVQNVRLVPGNYQVSWTQTGNNVPVTILRRHKAIATVSGSVVEAKGSNEIGPYRNGTLELTKTPNGREELTKIDYSKVAIVLPMTSQTAR